MADDFLKRIDPWRQIAQDHLADNLKSPLATVQEVGRHILMSGGKRLRPVIFLLSARLCGDQDGSLARYSSVFEFLHCASLLHDDVIDEAQTRRGQVTAHRLWDNPTAILVGDHLFARALSLIAETGRPRVISILADCIAQLAEGQVLELIHQSDLEVGRDVYLEIITAKTAVLLAAAARVGAILGQPGTGAGSKQEEALHGFGLELGVAFQMIDDLLDWAGQEEVVGKPLGQDLKEGKATLPWILALEAAPEETRGRMLQKAANPGFGPEDWFWLKETVGRLGGFEAALKEALDYKERAKARLDLFDHCPAKELLLDLADYVCRRRY